MPDPKERALARAISPQPRLTPEQDDILREVNAAIQPGDAGRIRPGGQVMTENGPVLRPGAFLADPPVVGRPDFLQAARSALRMIPQADVSKIVQGPTGAAISDLQRSGFPPEAFGITNLMGIYDQAGDKSVGINPDIDGARLQETLIHELTHGRGFGEASARKAGKQWRPADMDEGGLPLGNMPVPRK